VSTEVRVVDPNTGGEKGAKLARFDLLPPGPLHHVAELYGKGAQKYAELPGIERSRLLGTSAIGDSPQTY
jgi:hypothetical protein